MHTSTSIVYGTAVRLSSLLFAADAFPSLEPTLRFFDLVSLRFRTGTLEFERRGGVEPAVSRVPPEVWQMFEEELVADELEEADNLFSDEVIGDKHAGWTWEEVTVGWVEDTWGIADRLYHNFRSSVFASARQAVRLPSSRASRPVRCSLGFSISVSSVYSKPTASPSRTNLSNTSSNTTKSTSTSTP